MHRAHNPQQDGAIADAGVEDAQGRTGRMDIAKLERDAARNHPFFAAGAHEEEILLPVIEEAEIALRIALAAWGLCGWRARPARVLQDRGAYGRCPVHLHEAANAVERLGGDAAPVTPSCGEPAVVDPAAAKAPFFQ